MWANYLLIIPATALLAGIGYVIWHYRTGKQPPNKKGMLAWSAFFVVLGIFFMTMSAFLGAREPFKTLLILTSPVFFWVAFVFYRRSGSAG